MANYDSLSEIFMEILDHIAVGNNFNYEEAESYMLRQHPEWAALFNDPEARNTVAEFLYSRHKITHENVKTIFEKIGK